MISTFARIKELSPAVRAVTLVTFFHRAGTMAFPFLVVFLTRERGMSVTTAGLLVVCYGIAGLLASPVSAWICNRYSNASALTMSLFGFGVFVGAVPWAPNVYALAALILGWALASGTANCASMALLSEMAAPEVTRVAFALNRTAVHLGMSIGPAAGGWIAMRSFPALFVVDAMTAVVGGLYWWNYRRRTRCSASAAAPAAESSVSFWGAIADRRLLLLVLALVPLTTVFFQYGSSLPHFVVTLRGFSEGELGLLFGLNALMVVLFELPLSVACREVPVARSVAIAAVLIGAGFGTNALVTSFAGLALGVAIWTLGEMLLYPAIMSHFAQISPSGGRASYMAWYGSIFSSANILAPLIGTQVLAHAAPEALWIGCLVVGAITAVALWRIVPAQAAAKG